MDGSRRAVVQCVEFFIDNAPQLIRRNSSLAHPDEGKPQFLPQPQLLLRIDFTGRRSYLRALPALNAHKSLLLQQPVSPRYCVEIESEIGCQCANRGKNGAGGQLSRGYPRPYLAGDLLVHRFPRRSIDYDCD